MDDRYDSRTQAEVESQRRAEHEAREHDWFRELRLDGLARFACNPCECGGHDECDRCAA